MQKTHEQPSPTHVNKPLVQQVFHKGMFNTSARPRSYSTGDTQRAPTHEIVTPNNETAPLNHEAQTSNTPVLPENRAMSSKQTTNQVTWQRIPGTNSKRNRSPEELKTTHKLQKRNEERQQLFNKNRPIQESVSTIETSNRFTGLPEVVEPRSDQINTMPAKPKRISKPPPIILYGIEDVMQLTNFLREVVNGDEFAYKITSENNVIISTKTVEIYKKLIDHIRLKGLIGHTFTRKDERCQKFVIKNLHHTTPKEAIVDAIEATGNKVKGEIVNARKRDSKKPYNIFFVNVEPNEKNSLVKTIEYIYHQKVKIEDPRRSNTMVQCTRCQQIGHTKNNCMRPFRCVKCAEPHNTIDCTKDKNTPAKCALCLGSHPASYRGCQVYQEIYARRNGKRRNETKSPNLTENVKKWKPLHQERQECPPTTTITTQQGPLATADETTAYSEVLKRQTKTKPPDGHAQKNANTQNFYASYSAQTDSQTRNECEKSLLEIVNKQAQKIDLLLTQMGTLMNLITTLINKTK